MKFFSSLLVVGIMIAVVGCGADKPFSRGPHIDRNGRLTSGNDDKSGPVVISRSFFEQKILPNLDTDCRGCHENKANKAPDYETALGMIVPGQPDQSYLYQMATGAINEHFSRWKADGPKAKLLAQWINGAE